MVLGTAAAICKPGKDRLRDKIHILRTFYEVFKKKRDLKCVYVGIIMSKLSDIAAYFTLLWNFRYKLINIL